MKKSKRYLILLEIDTMEGLKLAKDIYGSISNHCLNRVEVSYQPYLEASSFG